MRELLTFITCVLLWGTTFYAIEFQLGQVAPAWSVAYRFTISALVLAIYALVRGINLRFAMRDHVPFILLGTFLFSFNYIFTYYGNSYLPSGLVAVAFAMMSLYNIFNARLLLKMPLDTITLLAALLGVSGLILIFWPEVETLNLADEALTGLLFVLAASYSASLGNTVAATKSIQRFPVMAYNAWAMIYGSIINIIYALLTSGLPVLDDRSSYYISLMYLSILGTVIPFSLYLWLISRIGSAKSGYVAILVPIIALIISTIFEGYEWSLFAMVGLGLILSGNIIISIRRQKSS